MSIKGKILTAFSPAKLIEANPLRGKGKVIKKAAPSIKEACEGMKFAYESTKPLSLTSKTLLEKANETLNVLKAKGVYKKVQ